MEQHAARGVKRVIAAAPLPGLGRFEAIRILKPTQTGEPIGVALAAVDTLLEATVRARREVHAYRTSRVAVRELLVVADVNRRFLIHQHLLVDRPPLIRGFSYSGF